MSMSKRLTSAPRLANGCAVWRILAHDLSQPLPQMPPLGLVAHQREGASVRLGGLRVAAEPAQQFSPSDGQQMILGELAATVELVHQREPTLESERHRDRDRPVEL